MYPYITLGDGTEIVHSHIIINGDDKEVEVNFERPVDTGFHTARCVLPSYIWKTQDGFSDEEIRFFLKLLESNAHLLFRYAESGGLKIA